MGETHYTTVTQSGRLALDGGQEFRTRRGPRSPRRVAGEAALAAEGVLTTEATQPAEIDGTHLDPRKRYDWLTETRSLIDEGKPIALPVRELVARWEAPTIYPKVEADLANHGIATVPNFRKVSLETVVRLASADDALADSSPDDETA